LHLDSSINRRHRISAVRSLADDNLHLREIAAHVTGRHTAQLNRGKIDTLMQTTLSEDQSNDPAGVELSSNGRHDHPRKLSLRALTKEGYVKGVTGLRVALSSPVMTSP
jgi:hypothetical protein